MNEGATYAMTSQVCEGSHAPVKMRLYMHVDDYYLTKLI